MIIDRIEEMLRGERKPSLAQVQLADAFSVARGLDEKRMFNSIFRNRAEADAGRPPISGSSPFYCPRRLAFKLWDAHEEPPAPRSLWAWYMGRVIESMVTRLVILSNSNVVWPQLVNGELKEYEVEYEHPSYGPVKGHVDMVIGYEGQNVPVEFKSMATRGFGFLKRSAQISNKFGHVSQLNFYAHCMGVKTGFYVGVNKDTGHQLEIQHDYDGGQFMEDMANLDEALRFYDMEDGPGNEEHFRVPPYPPWVEFKTLRDDGEEQRQLSEVRCTYCPYTARCHPTFHRETNRKGQPVWLEESTHADR